jgi:hypothetical protein
MPFNDRQPQSAPMRPRRERLARIVVSLLWMGGLILALRLGIGAVDPSQVLGLLIAVYLGIWGVVFFLRPNATTTNAARFSLVTLSIGLTIGLVELPALLGRIDYRDIFQTPTAPWRRHGHRPDADLIYVREAGRHDHQKFIGGELAGLSGVGTRTVYEADIHYDAEGFRNPSVRKTADIVVVGDSFVEGLHVSDAELMTTKLARETELSVVNLGRSGDGPQQERFVLERFGLPKHPKICIWLFYEGNDLEDAAEYEGNRAIVASLGPISMSRTLYERCFLRNALMFARTSWFAPEKKRSAAQFQAVFASRNQGDITMTFASEDHRRNNTPAKIAKAIEAIQAAEALCQRNGVKLIVVFVPTKLRVYRETCRFAKDFPGIGAGQDALPETLRNALGKMTFLDLTPELRRRAARGELTYFADDTHWTSLGHTVATEAIKVAWASPVASAPGVLRSWRARSR